jgi:iron complex transport system substrate-binding protein
MKKILLLLLIPLTACQPRPTAGDSGETYAFDHARGLRVTRSEGYTKVEVKNPWDTTKLLRTYLLVPDSLPVPDDLPAGEVIRTPVKRIVAYASAHCAMLEAIGAQDRLVGVCESRYVALDFVKQGIATGTIADTGEAFAPDIERIIDLQPDVLIATPIENMSYGQVEKIGVPFIEATEYLENTPLGRAEWIRFFGLLCGREAQADSAFRQIVESYEEVKALTASVAVRPTVLPEIPYPPVWYVPGGDSYMAHLYRDAGADYPWSDDRSTGSLTLSIEAVLEKGVDADTWVMKYNLSENMTYSNLQSTFEGASRFAAFQNKRIFAANTAQSAYYDEVAVWPDRVLRDLVWVFHPECLPANYAPRYFHRMLE